LLDAVEIRARFPAFAVGDDEIAYFEHEAGFLRPEACIAAQLELAARHGAQIQRNQRVLRFSEANGMVRVETEAGAYQAGKLIAAAGAWLPQLDHENFGRLLTVKRQVLFWFAVKPGVSSFELGRFPVFIWELPGSGHATYGFPALDGPQGGVKIATEQLEVTTTADSVERAVAPEEIAAMYERGVAPCFPGIENRCVKTRTCLYTMTPDFNFLVDVHPQLPNVIIASPCSGHGFKHSAAVGEALAKMSRDEPSLLDDEGFRLARFQQAERTAAD
jgi:sarcosine oxidase